MPEQARDLDKATVKVNVIRFGIEPHEAPVTEFAAQPSQKDGLGGCASPTAYLLTTIIRSERFSEGSIADAYERGTLLAIAERAKALIDAKWEQPE